MTVLLDSRSLKALQIAAGAAMWTRLVGRAFYIPSQRNPAQCYVTSPDTCQCPDSTSHPDQLCKHSIAVSIVLAIVETQAAAGQTMDKEEVVILSGERLAQVRRTLVDALTCFSGTEAFHAEERGARDALDVLGVRAVASDGRPL